MQKNISNKAAGAELTPVGPLAGEGLTAPQAADLLDDEDFPRDPAGYLSKRGWKKVLANLAPSPVRRWRDPLSGKGAPQKVLISELDHQGNGVKTPHYQMIHPSAEWFYSLTEAIAIQRERDGRRA